MGRGITQSALQGSKNAANAGETANLRGQNIYNDLFPQLTSEATNPQGYGTVGLNAMNTANQQSIGGSDAAAAGEGANLAARTRNAGAAQPAISEANRSGARQLSQNAVGIQAGNEQMRQKQQQAALSGLQGLYGTEMNTALGQGNLQNAFLGTGVKSAAQTTSAWEDPLIAAMGDASKVAAAYAGGGGGGCWIAEAIWGIDDKRTHITRWWLNNEFTKHWFGRLIMAIYIKIGRKVAKVVERHAVVRNWLTPLFELALRKAINARS